MTESCFTDNMSHSPSISSKSSISSTSSNSSHKQKPSRNSEVTSDPLKILELDNNFNFEKRNLKGRRRRSTPRGGSLWNSNDDSNEYLLRYREPFHIRKDAMLAKMSKLNPIVFHKGVNAFIPESYVRTKEDCTHGHLWHLISEG